MAVFAYQGRGAAGIQKGEIEAADRMAAVGELRRRAILVTQISEKAGGKTPVRIGSKVKDRDMAIFTRQFSTMISIAMARPRPSTVGMSCWHKTPSSTSASWARI